MLSLTFFFTAHKLLLCLEMSDRMDMRSLYKMRLAAHVIIKVCKEDAMNDALCASLSNYIERASKLHI